MTGFSPSVRRFLGPVGVLACASLIAAWFVFSRPHAEPVSPQEKIWPVSVIVAAAEDVRPEIVAFGEIHAAREAELRALVAGRLVSLNPEFRDGNLLSAGTELAVIDPVDYQNKLAEQRAELARTVSTVSEAERELEWESQLLENARVQVTLAERGLERTRQLQAQGRESKKALDDAESVLATNQQNALQRGQAAGRLRSRIEQQQSALQKAQATLAMAERELARTRVIAPFDGYVTEVKLALGKLLGVGESLGRLLAANELEVRFDLPEADFARLMPEQAETATSIETVLLGREISVIWHLGDTERHFSARLQRIGSEIDATLGGIKFIASLNDDVLQHGLRAGAFVEVRVPDKVYRDVYRIPARALSDRNTVYAVRNGRLAAVPVTVARSVDSDILVMGAFVDGEMVVARSFAGIGPGLRVRAL
jgi:membrane fusion protein, multidrug efflux system